MTGNGWDRIWETTEGWRWTQPLKDGDIVMTTKEFAYIVEAREVHAVRYRVFAENAEDAFARLDNGEGELISDEFSHMLERNEDWKAEMASDDEY